MGPEAISVANRAVLLSGSARSGTSVLGAAVASFKNFELDYESPTLLPLLASGNRVDSETFRLIWASHVHRKVVIDALAGRSLNLNRHEESSAHRYLPSKEIEQRLSKAHTLAELHDSAHRARPLLKIPQAVTYLDRVATEFPGTKFVVTGRAPEATITSLLARGWFHDEMGLASKTTSPVRNFQGIRVPFWVPNSKMEEFAASSELDKAIMYYLFVHETSAGIANGILIDYDELVEKPHETLEFVAEYVQGDFGDRTIDMISQFVERPVSSSQASVLDAMRPSQIREICDTWDKWTERRRECESSH
jgi:hypothetical protein